MTAGAIPEGEVAHFRFRFQDVRPESGDVEAVLGYARGRSPGPVAEAIAERLCAPEDLWSVEGGFVLHDGSRVDGGDHVLVVGDVVLDVGRIISGQLGRSTATAAFLCTAGPGIERLSRDLMSSGDPFTGYIADTVGSLVVERAMDRVHDTLQEQLAARGLRVTNRYSPGYCGWKVNGQQQLFRLLPAGFCGVRLTESSLMQPIKTVSGVIGCGRDVRRNPYTCHLCEMEQCLYRSLQQPS